MATTGPTPVSITSDEMPAYSPLKGWDARRIQQAKVMVVGAGALGNEVLKNLALVGVKQILIIDFDVVERTNLAKSVLYRDRDCTGERAKVDIAAERLRDISPDLKIQTINGDATVDVGLGLFREMDVVIGCLDNRLTRMWLNRFCFALGKGWVDGGILELAGQVDVYIPTGNCYECGLGPKALSNIQYRNGCLNRMKRYASAGLATTNILAASVVGAIQVQEALKLIAEPEKSLAGSQFCFEGRVNYYDRLGKQTPLRKGCQSHQRYDPIVEAPELSASTSVETALAWLSARFDDPQPSIRLHYAVILNAATARSEKLKPFIKPRPHITEKDLDRLREVEDEEVRFRDWTDTIDEGFPDQQLSLRQLGVPDYHILQVAAKGQIHYVALSADRDFLKFS